MPLRELLDEAAGLLVVQHRPEQRDSRCSVDAVDHRLRAEGEELPGDDGEPIAEQRPKPGLVLGGATDEKEGGHCQALLPSTGDEPLLSVCVVLEGEPHLRVVAASPSANHTQRSTS